jgi:hypothetical protein
VFFTGKLKSLRNQITSGKNNIRNQITSGKNHKCHAYLSFENKRIKAITLSGRLKPELIKMEYEMNILNKNYDQ